MIATALAAASRHAITLSEETQVRRSGPPLIFERATSVQISEGRRVHSLSIQFLKLQPRRIGFFNVHSVYELVGESGVFDIDLQHLTSNDFFGIRGMVESLPAVPARARLAAARVPVRLDSITIRFHQASTQILEARAHEARESDDGGVELRNVVLARSDGVFVRSRRIIWSDQRQTFGIPGAFSIWDGKQFKDGRAAELSLDLTIRPSSLL